MAHVITERQMVNNVHVQGAPITDRIEVRSALTLFGSLRQIQLLMKRESIMEKTSRKRDECFKLDAAIILHPNIYFTFNFTLEYESISDVLMRFRFDF